MATRVVTAAYCQINGATNLHQWAQSIQLELEADVQDDTDMSSNGWREFLAGLKTGKLTVEVHNDWAASQLDAALWPLFGTVVPFEVRIDQAAVSANNPKYTGYVVISKYTPIAGKVGEVGSASLQWQLTGPVARATS
jgi:hypothetical protein